MTKERALAKLRLKVKKVQYACIGHELHQDGTDHLHALIQGEDKTETRNANYFDLADSDDEVAYHGNYQGAKNNEDVRDYVMKSGDFIEEGTFLTNKQSEVQKRAIENKMILESDLPALVDKGEVSLYSYVQLRNAKTLYALDSIAVPDYIPRTCIWIYGETGIGKSRYIRDNYPGMFYNKMQNKWWDGYKGEQTVLLDDADHGCEIYGHLLKIWADCYSFNAEVKGSTIKPVYTRLYITSQYLPRDIWCKGTDQAKWDDEMRKAIERRFKIMTIAADGKTLIDYY